MRGRPGTKALPFMGGGRAVGGPIALGLLGMFFGLALFGFAAASVVLLAAAPDLAARDALALRPVLAVHLLALGFLPFVVTGASFHLLPVMLRNDVAHPRRLLLALLLLLGGFLVAPGIAWAVPGLLWPGAVLLTAGLGTVLVELLGLVRNAPAGRMLVASRTGVTLSCLNVVIALVLGALVFSRGDDPVAGVSHDRWMLVHLHVAVLGWLAMLILTVGRTLGPMLAVAPTAPVRRWPLAAGRARARRRRLDARHWNRHFLERAGACGWCGCRRHIGVVCPDLGRCRARTAYSDRGTARASTRRRAVPAAGGRARPVDAGRCGFGAAGGCRLRDLLVARLGGRCDARPPRQVAFLVVVGVVAPWAATETGCALSAQGLVG